MAHKPTILMVDNELSLLHYLERSVARMGYGVDAYSDPWAALAAFESEPTKFDLLITDLSMPGIPGTELLGRARARRSDLPAILMTGYADDRVGETDSASDALLLLKPFTLADLKAVLVRALP